MLLEPTREMSNKTPRFDFIKHRVILRGSLPLTFSFKIYFVFQRFCMCECLSICVPGVSLKEETMKALDTLELEFLLLASSHVNAGNETQSFARAASAFNCTVLCKSSKCF
jgi:hypothetical protein